MKEFFYEKLLNIKTGERQAGDNRSVHYNRYEPTPYYALEYLFNQYELRTSDHLVDFGCGKGRLNFYSHYLLQISVTGIEMNEEFYEAALKNQIRYQSKTKYNSNNISFHCCLAENYNIRPEDNRFYFFNPFSVQIFIKVINNILSSVEAKHREVDIILYYPTKEYLFYLNNHSLFELHNEIILPGYYDRNQNERFMIYRLIR